MGRRSSSRSRSRSRERYAHTRDRYKGDSDRGKERIRGRDSDNRDRSTSYSVNRINRPRDKESTTVMLKGLSTSTNETALYTVLAPYLPRDIRVIAHRVCLIFCLLV